MVAIATGPAILFRLRIHIYTHPLGLLGHANLYLSMIANILSLNSYHFSALGISYISTGLLVLAFSLISLIQSNFQKSALYLFFLCLMISCWLVGYSFLYSAKESAQALELAVFLFGPVAYLPPTSYLFLTAFLNKTKSRKKYTYTFFIISTAFVISQFNNQIITNQIYHYSWGYYVKYDHFYGGLFLLYFLAITLFCFYEIFAEYQLTPHASKKQRRRLKFIAASYLVGYLAGIDFIPAFEINIIPIGFIIISIFIAMLIYAIERYHLLGMDHIIASKIFEIMNESLIVCDSDGMIQILNSASLKLTGYSKHELINLPITTLLSKQGSQSAAASFIDILRKKSSFLDFEYSIKTKNNQLIPVSISAQSRKKTKAGSWLLMI